jgi:KUP system potassium uptake protein
VEAPPATIIQVYAMLPAPLAAGPDSHRTVLAPRRPATRHAHTNFGLALAALGVIYGDIGTSPLYAVKECFHGLHAMALNEANVKGVLSLIFWSLTMVVSVKYVTFIMVANNKGEGGIFALLALLGSPQGKRGKGMGLLTVGAIFGAALLYSDGIITPAISVLSAVEGLSVATAAATRFVLPITCGILFALFMGQRHGTETIGKVFGPIMIIWFLAIGALGVGHIIHQPAILGAVSPLHALQFFIANRLHGVVVLGAVVLCITGGEALYADMGHFGLRPIKLSWYAMVLPSLLCNYFGQGALLLADPSAASNPFYAMIPEPLLYPMVALATMASVIASQAMITGIYSLTQQAIQLGFCPRMRIIHTSEQTKGQIYLPGLNLAIMVGCLAVVLTFRESSRLAAAYGIAVTATMAITSLLYFAVLHHHWRWPLWKATPLLALFLCFDLAFLGSNLLKIVDGGWFTLLLAFTILVCLLTWRDGRAIIGAKLSASSLPVAQFLDHIQLKTPHRVPGTAVFMAVSPIGTPAALIHHFEHNKVLHTMVIILSVVAAETPQVEPEERLTIIPLGNGFHRIVARYGFMETPSVPEIAGLASERGLRMPIDTTTFFLGRETIMAGRQAGGMLRLRKHLFALMSRNAWNAVSFFGIPLQRVVEIGRQVEI